MNPCEWALKYWLGPVDGGGVRRVSAGTSITAHFVSLPVLGAHSGAQ